MSEISGTGKTTQRTAKIIRWVDLRCPDCNRWLMAVDEPWLLGNVPVKGWCIKCKQEVVFRPSDERESVSQAEIRSQGQ